MTTPFHLLPAGEPCAHLIAAGDTVKLAVLAEPSDVIEHSVCFEIWQPGGAQPINSHDTSTETFFFLSGEGEADSDGHTTPVRAGQLLILPPGTNHRIRNTGPGRLYAITTMLPDNGFAALVNGGPVVALDDDDLAVLAGRPG